MEVGIKVMVDDVLSGVEKIVTVACATYVAKPGDDRQVELEPVKLVSAEDYMEHAMAIERRKIHLNYNEVFKNLMQESNNEGTFEEKGTVSTDLTHVQTIELVHPPHVNHHGNTFGGQIMAWTQTVASISASLEVGVLVEACNCEEWIKKQGWHINSTFLIFTTVNDKGRLLTFPRIRPTEKGYVSYSNIAALMYLAEKPGWEIISELDNVFNCGVAT